MRAPVSQKFVEFRLGGETYRAPRLNLAQWNDLLAVYEDYGPPEGKSRAESFAHSLAAARIVLARAEPSLILTEKLECTPMQLRDANEAVLRFSGFEPGKSTAIGG